MSSLSNLFGQKFGLTERDLERYLAEALSKGGDYADLYFEYLATSSISLDYRAQEGFIYRLARDGESESSLLKKLLASKDSSLVSEFGGKRIVREPVPITKEEPLKLELAHFIQCVAERQTPKVSGAQAKAALDVAFEITRQIAAAAPPA